MATAKSANKSGRKPMTPAEKLARDASLKNETKSARFVRLAVPRVAKTLKAIDSVSKLTGGGYEYTAEQAKKITDALDNAVNAVKERFAGNKKAATGFTL